MINWLPVPPPGISRVPLARLIASRRLPLFSPLKSQRKREYRLAGWTGSVGRITRWLNVGDGHETRAFLGHLKSLHLHAMVSLDHRSALGGPALFPKVRYSYHDLSLVVYPSHLSILFDFGAPACKRLTTLALSPHEVIPLIQAAFTDRNGFKVIGYLRGDDAQTFTDAMHEVPHHAPSFPRRSLVTYIFSVRFLPVQTFTFPGSDPRRV